MPLFRRRSPAAQQQSAIAEFWDWWTSVGADLVSRAIAEGRTPEVGEELSRRVRTISESLAWELGAGTISQHELVITAEGDPAFRPIARRWLRAAPGATLAWQYADLRRASEEIEEVVLGIESHRIRLGEVSVAARRRGHRLDLTLHHPAFPDLEDGMRSQVAFLALDAALGEEDTELFIGEVVAAATPPLDGFGLAALRAVVGDIRRESLDEDDQPRWALLQGETPQGPVLAAAQIPLSPYLAPHLDQHVAVVVTYADSTEEGLPGPDALMQLRDLEQHLLAVQDDGAQLVAHESHQGVRVLHVYADSTTSAADDVKTAVRDWARTTGHDRPDVHVEDDPGWEQVAHLAG